jgi:hypothetical protein
MAAAHVQLVCMLLLLLGVVLLLQLQAQKVLLKLT